MLFGKFKLEVVDDYLTLTAEKNNDTVAEIKLEDQYYQDDVYSFAKNLMGDLFQIIAEEEGIDGLKEAIQEELETNF